MVNKDLLFLNAVFNEEKLLQNKIIKNLLDRNKAKIIENIKFRETQIEEIKKIMNEYQNNDYLKKLLEKNNDSFSKSGDILEFFDKCK
jgi:hypothetical protein